MRGLQRQRNADGHNSGYALTPKFLQVPLVTDPSARRGTITGGAHQDQTLEV